MNNITVANRFKQFTHAVSASVSTYTANKPEVIGYHLICDQAFAVNAAGETAIDTTNTIAAGTIYELPVATSAFTVKAGDTGTLTVTEFYR